MTKTLNIKELAREIVGDGKSPNKYFLTIAYGWYFPKSDNVTDDMPDMVQADNSLESVTILFTDKEQAEAAYDQLKLSLPKNNIVTGETIGQIMLEDRKAGVIKEKALTQRHNGTFGIVKF